VPAFSCVLDPHRPVLLLTILQGDWVTPSPRFILPLWLPYRPAANVAASSRRLCLRLQHTIFDFAFD
jgi:hypothetical protein